MGTHTLIVGGGVMGCSIAYQLARRADPIVEPVVLLERRHFGAGSSGRSGAILRQFYSDRELIGMARDSLREYASFEARTGRAIGFTRCGVLTLASPRKPDTVDLLERNIAAMREVGVEVERVGARRMRELVDRIEVDDGALGAWEPGSGFVDPQRTVDAFAALARSNGATARTNVEVLGLALEGRRARGVLTRDGCIEAQQVVVAAGPWTKRLLAAAGIDLPLRAVRPEQHFVAMPSSIAGSRVAEASGAPDFEIDPRFAPPPESAPAHPVLLDLELGYYTRCEPSLARTRVGAIDYERDRVLDDPDQLDERVSDEFQRWARGSLVQRLPVYRDRPDLDAQAAWYTLTPDAQALIGRVPGFENLYVVSGFSGHGFKLAPSIGEGVAQMLLHEPVGAFDASFFAPERFGVRAEPAWSGRFGL